MSDTKQKEPLLLGINKYAENTNSALQARGTRADIQNLNTHSSDQNAQKKVVLSWLGCLFFGFIPPLLFLLLNKEDAYVRSQAKEALNWCITFLIAMCSLTVLATMLGFVLALIFAPLAAAPALLVSVFSLSHILFCFIGAYKGFSGKNFRTPFNIRIIK